MDRSIVLLREGYAFIPSRCRRWQTDAFETRLMGQRVVCMSGRDAAEVFYAPGRMTRRRALPPTALTLLQDRGSVALLDGDHHRHRKELFLRLMRPGLFDDLIDLVAAEWRAAGERWQRRAAVGLHRAAQEVITRAVCTWAGVPVGESSVQTRTDEFAAMIDGAGSVGPRQIRGQVLRQRGEVRMRRVIERIRRGDVTVPDGSPAHAIAFHTNPDGKPLTTAVAAVELINVLRPTVAVARFVTFAALALHEHPAARAKLVAGEIDAEHFVQEVRRLSPFFPAIGGRVMEPFEWRGYRFTEGRWVLLDLYGTNRDPDAWADPGEFRPERFRDWQGDPYTLIPQGGGEHETNHRCPGEWITIALMKGAVEFLTRSIAYDVPDQDLTVDLSRMPAIPRSGFVITGVRLR